MLWPEPSFFLFSLHYSSLRPPSALLIASVAVFFLSSLPLCPCCGRKLLSLLFTVSVLCPLFFPRLCSFHVLITHLRVLSPCSLFSLTKSSFFFLCLTCRRFSVSSYRLNSYCVLLFPFLTDLSSPSHYPVLPSKPSTFPSFRFTILVCCSFPILAYPHFLFVSLLSLFFPNVLFCLFSAIVFLFSFSFLQCYCLKLLSLLLASPLSSVLHPLFFVFTVCFDYHASPCSFVPYSLPGLYCYCLKSFLLLFVSLLPVLRPLFFKFIICFACHFSPCSFALRSIAIHRHQTAFYTFLLLPAHFSTPLQHPIPSILLQSILFFSLLL